MSEFKLGLEGEAVDEEILECEGCGHVFSEGDCAFVFFEIDGLLYLCFRCFVNQVHDVRVGKGSPNHN